MTETGTTIVIMVVMVDGVIMMDGVEGVVVDGGRVPILASTLDRLTPPTDTMRILLHMGITDILHTGTTADTRTEAHTRLGFLGGRTPRWRAGWAPINPAAAPNHLHLRQRQ
jgi:hypothetical protein